MDGHMLRLGDFTFEVGTAAYQRLTRSDDYKWQGQDRLDNVTAEQNTGKAKTAIDLEGVVFPFYQPGGGTAYVGVGQIDAMRAEAEKRAPLVLVDGLGNVLGKYVIVTIQEDQEAHLSNGIARKQTFRLALRSYGEDDTGFTDEGDGLVSALDALVEPVKLPTSVDLLPGLPAEINLLAGKDRFAGGIAGKLFSGGVGLLNSLGVGNIASDVLSKFGQDFYGSITDATMSFARDLGMSGNPFKFALEDAGDALKARAWQGVEELFRTSVPGVTGFLGGLGIGDYEAAHSVVSLVRMAAEGDGLPGQFLDTALDGARGILASTALQAALGVDMGAVNSAPLVDRFPTLVKQFEDGRAANPSAWASAVGDNDALNSLVDTRARLEELRLAASAAIPTGIAPTPIGD